MIGSIAVRKTFLFALLFTVSTLVAPFTMASHDELCSLAQLTEDGIDTINVFGEAVCFGVSLPSPGILAIAATNPFESDAEPVLTFLGGASCQQGSSDEGSPRILERQVSGLVLAAPAADSYGFCIRAEDPNQPLGKVRLIRRFAVGSSSAGEDPDEAEPDPDPLHFPGRDPQKDEDPDEAEPDPDPLANCSDDPGKDEDPDEAEPDPDPLAYCSGIFGKDEDPDEAEPDPDPFGGQGGLCLPRAWSDDHADLAACASLLYVPSRETSVRQALGAIHHEQGWDEDVFVFEAEELIQLDMTIRSDIALVVSIHDATGHRLVATESTGRRAGKLLKVLPTGKYFLHLVGSNSEEGKYDLSLGLTSID